jgi:mono/diheme cytochrome c family protein
VPLGELEAKYTLEGLAGFLSDPLASRSHGRMPRLVANMAEAVDLATYLLRDVVVVPPTETVRRRVYAGQWGSLPDFERLSPEFEDRVPELQIADIAIKPGFGVVFDGYLEIPQTGRYEFQLSSDDGSRLILDGKTLIDHDGVHATSAKSTSVELKAGVVSLRVEYFEAGGERSLQVMVNTPGRGKQALGTLISTKPTGREQSELVPSRFRPDASLVARGRALFESSGCAECHRRAEPTDSGEVIEVTSQTRGPAQVGAEPKGCLAPEVPAGAVDYQLTLSQRLDILAALAEPLAAHTDDPLDPHAALRSSLEERLMHLNCYACHRRDERGGPLPNLSAFFQGTTPEMGDEGRLPPLLTGAGDKLTPEYLRQVIDSGTGQRPYMLTRMPGFGERPAQQLTEWFGQLDACCSGEPAVAEEPTPEEAMGMVAGGRLLAGNQGLGCVKCHTFNGQGPPGIRAIDLLVMPDRLRYDWLARYLQDPQKYRPGTRMPTSFPDGVSVVKEVADGDPTAQTRALWAYLSQGKEARPPVGLLPEAIILRADDRPLIYRNFIEGLSPRGIAVGYPEGVNVAWDAGRLALAKLWKYDFMDASRHWIGRGVGSQGPLGDAMLDLDRGPSVIGGWLESDQVWPSELDADRQRFLGYRLNDRWQPIFRYRVDGVTVEEGLVPTAGEAGLKQLERSWTIAGSGRVSLRLAVANDSLEAGSLAGDSAERRPDTFEYVVDRLYRMQVEGPGRLLELDQPGGRELRWQIDLDAEPGPVRINQTIQW